MTERTYILITLANFSEPLSFPESKTMDPYAFIPACLTTALYWTWWYPADQPCLPALVLKVPNTKVF